MVNWPNVNKTSMSAKKTELVIFKSKRKQIDGEIKLNLPRNKLFPTDSVFPIKLGIQIY